VLAQHREQQEGLMAVSVKKTTVLVVMPYTLQVEAIGSTELSV